MLSQKQYAERFRFHRRHQTEGKTLTDYIVDLKRLASTCKFGHFLNDALRDQLVCGYQMKLTISVSYPRGI